MAEILAPAGDMQSLEAAVRSGADAVYLGAPNFNARRNATNFSFDELKNAILFCKERGVGVHIVLNTLLFDEELPSAVDTAVFAVQSGADALILQDTGLALLLKEILPSATLHASTQMTIHSIEGLQHAKDVGFSRAVLSRELSFDEIKRLQTAAKSIGIETEVFVHGALCMSMSGQCYLSSMIGGRSGNRGLCAQPCRLPFSTKEGYAYSLSLKDMSHLSALKELAEMGVDSFKIEGRMKDAEYVAAAVTAARKALCEGTVSDEMNRLLRSAFSRSGFTDGYLSGKRQDMFGIRTDTDARLSKEVQNSIHDLYRREFQRIRLDFELICEVGKPAILRASDTENTVEVFGDEVQKSTSRPIEYDFVKEKLARLGGTPYLPGDLRLTADQSAFLSIPAINELKKSAIELLTQKRCELSPVSPLQPITKQAGREPVGSPLIRARFCSALPQKLSGISRAYLPHTCDDADFERILQSGAEAGVELPRTYFKGSDEPVKRLLHLKNLGVKYALCECFAALKIAKGIGFECDMGMLSQITNSYSCISAKNQGASSVTASFECTLEQINSLASPLPIGIVGYGRLPLMLTRCCPLKNSRDCKDCRGGYLTDRMGKSFFVKCRDGASELFNCVPLEMCNKLSQIKNADFVMLYFTDETPQQIETEIEDWKKKKTDRREFTHGLYYRGVQ